MKIRKVNEETRSFWERVTSAVKFEKDGLWGLKSPSGEIVLAPKYDQVELCTDFVYAHYEDRHKFFYKDGGETDCADRDDEYQFYENGMVGLKDVDGNVILEPKYDEIYEWGENCDVIYTRLGKDYHYYNHNLEEILTDVEYIEEDTEPECPYSIGEDQNRNIMLCVEPISTKEGDRDCFAYGQWVRLNRIRCKDVRKIFSDCEVVNITSDAIEKFEDKDTYIYSARICQDMGDYPITSCIEKFKTLGCYNSSWNYLLKISYNKKTKINPHDLYNLIKHFEDIEYDLCIRFDIAIDYDDSLEEGVVQVFQLHYFWDDMGAFLYDDFLQEILPNGTIDEIRKVLDNKSSVERRKLIADAYWWITNSKTRSWDDTKKVLEFLKSVGSDDFSMLIACNMKINRYWIEEITPAGWQFKKDIISWALQNGGQLNQIDNGKTLFDQYIEDLETAKEHKEKTLGWQESFRNADSFAEWLKSVGAISTVEQRRKIEAKLDGLAPQEVLELVKKM